MLTEAYNNQGNDEIIQVWFSYFCISPINLIIWSIKHNSPTITGGDDEDMVTHIVGSILYTVWYIQYSIQSIVYKV